ncbi:beta,beta-carotene 15,15'-dioxygenase-like [Liolophura sinensis]|uniref:beta,beta-carotene 15,15'-dioxygenase-like n=1 Tax=Liolophura sinensis TaxID=3198878 RepID=UPI0031595838
MESLYMNTDGCDSPIEGKVTGTIPSWLNGSLYRNGPGKFSIGDSSYKHWFDGLALLHCFRIKLGRVTYCSKFVKSETFKRNMAANRIVVHEFGTTAYPDPCKNIFQRMFAWFVPESLTDNTLVTVTPRQDFIYTATETNALHKIDPLTLDTLEKVNISKLVAVNMATAHYHHDNDGTLHNIGVMFQGRPKTSIFKVPPPSDGKELFEGAEIVGSSYSRWPFHLCYMHSFGMSENYYVYVEQPLCLNVSNMVLSKFTQTSFCEWLQWYGNEKAAFRVMDKKTGQIVNPKMPYMAGAFFMFHHINTYEDNGFLVVDVCGYDNADVVNDHYLKNLRTEVRDPISAGKARRYNLPLNAKPQDEVGTSYMLENSLAKAEKKENSILCQHEELCSEAIELPQINYKNYNGRKYRYAYGAGGDYLNQLVKVDVKQKSCKVWKDGNLYTSEPVFVPTPGANREDDGVLLAVLYEVAEPSNKTHLLVLNAESMEEIGRVQFDVHVPRDIHGVFINDKPSD